jgi:formylmethanofuran dehydrogenase subunit E
LRLTDFFGRIHLTEHQEIFMQQATATPVMTELTCWKCGEESLKAAANDGATRGANGEPVTSAHVQHSECQKCGTYSVNHAQAMHNKTVARKARKSLIRAANLSST